MDFALKKNHIIAVIQRINSETLLMKIEDFVTSISQQKDMLSSLSRPLKETLNLEEMIVEQSYQGPTLERMHQISKEINIEQSTEELLAMI